MATGLQLAHSNVLQNAFSDGFQSFVSTADNTLIASSTLPLASGRFYSTITNRAPITDISKDLKCSMGVERIVTHAIHQLQTESGPNGEPVWGVMDDSRGLFRFVGSGWRNYNDTYGARPNSAVNGDYIEVTFFGTGINILSPQVSGFTNDWRVSVDGGTEGANIVPSSLSSVIGSRNYATNQILTVASGLPLGIHTVRIRSAGSGSFYLQSYAFEIINQASSININTGSAYIDGLRTNLSAQTESYNSGFESGTLGARGGHVAVYLKSNGTIGKAVTPTDSSSGFLTGADHTNEEIARNYHFREFGAGRSDDFNSILTGAAATNYAFTLEDGTTTLAGSGVGVYSTTASQSEGIGFIAGGYVTLTFVGTGVDVYETTVSTAGPTATVFVDGVNVGTIAQAAGSRYRKIASGLPYGTHTLKIVSVNLNDYLISRYVVYQPKKPAIPTGAIELADYNILATYSGTGITGTAVADWLQAPTGTIYKSPLREFIYIGANWQAPSVEPSMPSGFTTLGTLTNNSQPARYTFFGTGFVVQTTASGLGTVDFTVTVNGSLNASGVARSNASNLGGGSYRCTSTTSTSPCRIEFSGLSLGLYTVDVQRSAGTGNFAPQGLHIITPIHSYGNSPYSDLQNTLPVGSCSLSDNRTITPIKEALPTKKSWAQAVGITSSPTTTSNAFVPMPDMSVTLQTSGGMVRVSYAASVSNAVASVHVACSIYVDGFQVSSGKDFMSPSVSNRGTIADSIRIPLAPGTHKFDVYWVTGGGGTATATSTSRNILVEEV